MDPVRPEEVHGGAGYLCSDGKLFDKSRLCYVFLIIHPDLFFSSWLRFYADLERAHACGVMDYGNLLSAR
jgi:hypothetical protein